jgi:hypothetical protein
MQLPVEISTLGWQVVTDLPLPLTPAAQAMLSQL